MANQNIRTPRFYTDIVAYLLSRGTTQNGNFDVVTGSGLIGIQNGSEAELFDLRPLNIVDFNTSADTDGHVLINLNTSTFKKNYIAILNHNMNTAKAKLHVRTSDTLNYVDDVDLGSATRLTNPIEIMNADSIATSIITPATDGHTIVTFTETDDRYIGLQFEGSDSGDFDGTTDLFIGCIMVGEYYDMPHAPDLSVKRRITFDQVTQSESLGGQRYSTMVNSGKTTTTTSKSPFNTDSYSNKTYGGRTSFDMSFNYLSSADIMPVRTNASNLTDDAIVEDVWNRTNGSHLPFIFSVDNETHSSTAHDSESDHIFARFAQDSLEMTQVAPDVFNIKMKIEEEF